jgi:hypothetical protein
VIELLDDKVQLTYTLIHVKQNLSCELVTKLINGKASLKRVSGRKTYIDF